MPGLTVLMEMWTAPGASESANPPAPRATAASASSSGSDVSTTSHEAKSAKIRCGARAVQCCCPLGVAVIGQHRIAVLKKVDGKGMSHMAETDHTDVFESARHVWDRGLQHGQFSFMPLLPLLG